MTNYHDRTVVQLRALAKKRNITIPSGYKKEQIVNLLRKRSSGKSKTSGKRSSGKSKNLRKRTTKRRSKKRKSTMKRNSRRKCKYGRNSKSGECFKKTCKYGRTDKGTCKKRASSFRKSLTKSAWRFGGGAHRRWVGMVPPQHNPYW